MYYVQKTFEVAGSHKLDLPYSSKCKNLHGHNWIVKVYCKSKVLNGVGMVVDFKHIKEVVADYIDHQNLNSLFDFNPTAENIAKWICDEINKSQIDNPCYKVSVQESQGNVAIYEREEE